MPLSKKSLKLHGSGVEHFRLLIVPKERRKRRGSGPTSPDSRLPLMPQGVVHFLMSIQLTTQTACYTLYS